MLRVQSSGDKCCGKDGSWWFVDSSWSSSACNGTCANTACYLPRGVARENGDAIDDEQIGQTDTMCDLDVLVQRAFSRIS